MFKEANRIQVKEDLSYHKGESQVGYPSQPIEKKKIYMSILKALLWRRIAKIWKDGKSTAWLLSCRPAALLPAYHEAQVSLKRKTGMVSPFPLCMNRQLSDTGTVKYELKATVKKKTKETWNSLSCTLTPCPVFSLSHTFLQCLVKHWNRLPKRVVGALCLFKGLLGNALNML